MDDVCGESRLLDLKGPECSKQEKLYGTEVAGVLPCAANWKRNHVDVKKVISVQKSPTASQSMLQIYPEISISENGGYEAIGIGYISLSMFSKLSQDKNHMKTKNMERNHISLKNLRISPVPLCPF